MDVQMPEMDGLEATRRLREREARQRSEGEAVPHRTYVVAMTANALEGDREVCLQAGMDDYVSKPVRTQALVAALGRGAAAVPPAPVMQSMSDRASEAIEPALGLPNKRNAAAACATGSGSDEAAALAPAALENLQKLGGAAFISEMAQTFLEDGPLLLRQLRLALEEGDAAKTRLAAHSLKGNAAEFGATAFCDTCQKIEDLAVTGELVVARDLLPTAEGQFGQVSRALNRLTGVSTGQPLV
jgi:HPt (histidine-containing phosphotransfer) domain-containing protein